MIPLGRDVGLKRRQGECAKAGPTEAECKCERALPGSSWTRGEAYLVKWLAVATIAGRYISPKPTPVMILEGTPVKLLDFQVTCKRP